MFKNVTICILLFSDLIIYKLENYVKLLDIKVLILDVYIIMTKLCKLKNCKKVYYG